MLHLACFRHTVFGSLGNSPEERRFFKQGIEQLQANRRAGAGKGGDE